MIRNDPHRIIQGVHHRIIRAIRANQEWKWRQLNHWRMVVLGYFAAAAILGCIDPANCQPKADESPFDHGYHIVISSVTVDTCAICGKSPQ
jgi:hypothetical protein